VAKRTKVEPINAPTLFELRAEPEHAERQKVENLEIPGLLLGTSSFTARGWEGTFYPRGMNSRDYLGFYSKRFRTVEVDSTFYGTPKPSTVENWKGRTPADFVFAVKIPQIITHEKILIGCEQEFDEFIETIGLLGDKLGPMLFQFPKFDKWTLKDSKEFISRFDSFLRRVTSPVFRFAIELRNKNWLDARLTDFLRTRNVALALTDTTFVPRPWELEEPLDLVTADFAYIRWLGDRKGIEAMTTTWNRTIVDRTPDIEKWVSLSRALIKDRKLRHLFLFANNHYAGFAPATIDLFRKIWNEEDGSDRP